jgi:hypothetical protein
VVNVEPQSILFNTLLRGQPSAERKDSIEFQGRVAQEGRSVSEEGGSADTCQFCLNRLLRVLGVPLKRVLKGILRGSDGLRGI